MVRHPLLTTKKEESTTILRTLHLYFTVPLALSQNDQNYTDIDNCLVSFRVHKDCFI